MNMLRKTKKSKEFFEINENQNIEKHFIFSSQILINAKMNTIINCYG